jgi:hypothetical protein
MANYYGAVLDSGFQQFIAIDFDNSQDQRVIGYLNDDDINYFNSPLRIRDNRPTRSTILDSPLKGDIMFMIDKDRVEDPDAFQNITNEELEQLFTILEFSYVQQGFTASAINAHFIGDSDVEIYVEDSFDMSTNSTGVDITLSGGESITVYIKDWIRFSVVMQGIEYTFKLWLNNEAFVEDYPYSTISKIITACDPARFINPVEEGSIQAIIDAQDWDNPQIGSALATDDYTSLIIYRTKYIDQQTATPYTMPFGILYKGQPPSSLDIRAAIKQHLLNTGLTSENTWKTLFPNLFVTDQFFIFPIWEQTAALPDRELIPGGINIKIFWPKAKEIWPDMDPTFIENDLEIITSAYDSRFICIIADPNNPNTLSFIGTDSNDPMRVGSHPTYQPYNPTNTVFKLMAEITQEFAIKFLNCLAVLNGATNSSNFSENIFYNRRYLSFIVNSVEYHVLYRTDYILDD